MTETRTETLRSPLVDTTPAPTNPPVDTIGPKEVPAHGELNLSPWGAPSPTSERSKPAIEEPKVVTESARGDSIEAPEFTRTTFSTEVHGGDKDNTQHNPDGDITKSWEQAFANPQLESTQFSETQLAPEEGAISQHGKMTLMEESSTGTDAIPDVLVTSPSPRAFENTPPEQAESIINQVMPGTVDADLQLATLTLGSNILAAFKDEALQLKGEIKELQRPRDGFEKSFREASSSLSTLETRHKKTSRRKLPS
ncbi:hypothetical protein U9M48_001784 [Paspalum notatum var. saurae]|uniref:Uncharacterized protein n=1 Tax=Paspalum notatum var. saurae TaxID=547442 RepID=A0AAQ3PPH0_PASNO